MKTIRIITKMTIIAVVLCLLGCLASCRLSGSLKMESFTVDRATVKTSYYLGEAIDFSGIRATVTYSDSALNREYGINDLTLEYPEDITATVGNKEVIVSFMDPHLNVKQQTKVGISVSEDPNAIKHDGYRVDASAMKTVYTLGDDLDFTGIKLFETFTNGGAEVEITDLSGITYDYDETVTSTTGSKNIAVSYNGENAGVINITVNVPAVISHVADTSAISTEYFVGDVVSLKGLVILLTYENGETREVTDFVCKEDLTTVTSTYGSKDLHLEFHDPLSGNLYTINLGIRVDGMTSYKIDTHGMTLAYDVGATVSFEGIKVIASYYYGEDREIAFTDLVFEHENDLTAQRGYKQITIKFEEEIIGQFVIQVGDLPTAMALLKDVKTSYRVGETVSLDGLSVSLSFKDSTLNQTIPFEQLTVLTDLTDLGQTPGEKEVSVQYLLDGETPIIAKILITVWGVDSYTIDVSGMKTEYIVGGTVDYTGLSILANYKDQGASVPVDLSTVRFDDQGATATVGQKLVLLYIGDQQIGSVTLTIAKNAVVSHRIEGSYNNVFELGQTPDFTGLTLVLNYINGDTKTFALSDLTVGKVDTSKTGTFTVTLKVTDPVNNEEFNASFSITVIAAKLPVVQYQASDALIQFKNANSSAGTLSYGQNGFSTQFINQTTYVIGDDNEFILTPKFAVTDNGSVTILKAFYADVELAIHNGSTFETLQKRTLDPQKQTFVSYYWGDVLVATVDTYNGKYQFTSDTVGKQIRISVLPSSIYYTSSTSLNPVILEAKIIDAYNVTEAWQLAVIENYSDRNDWDEFKAIHGLTGVNPAGIVLHNDVHISADDIPQSFLMVTDKDILYKNSVTGETQVAPKGTRYLMDNTFVYHRDGHYSFTMQGNFFSIDLKKFPLVPSYAVFESEVENTNYGYDFSNSSLFVFDTQPYSNMGDPGYHAKATVENMGFIGNAGRNNFVDKNDDLVSAGGMILFKPRYYTDMVVNNCLINSFYISFIADMDSTLTIDRIKCYDSYQNAFYIWGKTVCTVDNSYLNGAGGPLTLCQTVERSKVYYEPTLVITNTITETHLTGEEIWFNALGVSAIVSDIKALGAGLNQGGLGNFVDKNGKMNIVGAIIADLDDSAINAGAMIGAVEIQATLLSNGHGMERWHNQTLWGTIYNHPAFAAMAPFLTVKDTAGNDYAIFFNGTTFCDIYGNALGTQAEHAALVAAFQKADHITLSQGGLTVLLELYHY